MLVMSLTIQAGVLWSLYEFSRLDIFSHMEEIINQAVENINSVATAYAIL